jgi:hypothetical protein
MKRVLVPFVASVLLASAASADRPPIQIHPIQVSFGRQPFESFTRKSFAIENRSSRPLRVTLESIQMPDDFSPVQIESTCALGDTWLAPHERCTHVVGFRPTPFFGGNETASIRVTAWNEAGGQLAERIVSLGGTGVERIGAPPVLDLDPTPLRFGRQPFGSHTEQALEIENGSSQGLWVTVEQLDVPDDFSPGQPASTCPLGSASGPTWLAPGQSCTHVVGFDPTPFFGGRETARMIVTAHDAGGTLLFARIVKLSGTGVPAP